MCAYTHWHTMDACVRVVPTQLCRQQTNVPQNRDNGNVRDIGQGVAGIVDVNVHFLYNLLVRQEYIVARL